MKTIPCSGPGICRNVDRWNDDGEHEVVGVKRNVEVADDHQGAAFCSFECALYAWVMSLKNKETKDAREP